jgi:tetratricopeptide (TPR) repeat protein
MRNLILSLFVVLAIGTARAQEAPPTGGEDPRELVEKASQVWAGMDARKSQAAEAEALLKKAAAMDGRLIEAHFNLALLYDTLGRGDESRAALEKVFQLDPQYANGLALRGAQLLKRGLRTEAMTDLNAALAKDPYNPIANNELAAQSIRDGNHAEAIRYSRLALLLDSGNLNSYINIALAYLRMGEVSLARLVCENALSISPNAAPIFNILGLLALKDNNVTAAIVQFEKAVAADADFAEAHMNLGSIMLNYNDFAGALAHWDAVLRLKPGDPDATLSRSVALRGLGKYGDAAAGYEDVLKKRPGDVGALYNRCILYQEYMSKEPEDYQKALGMCSDVVAHIDSKHPLWKEMNDRLKGIRDTIKVLQEQKAEEARQPAAPPAEKPAEPAAPAAPAAAPAPGTSL